MSASADVTRQKIKKEFDFKLSDKECRAKATEANALFKEAAKLSQEQKESNAAFKTKIEERETRAKELVNAADNGVEVRTVEAEMVKDFNDKSKKFYHEGKLILEEAMTESELQMEFGDEPKANSPEDLGYGKGKKLKVKKQSAKEGRREDAEKAEASKKIKKPKTADIVKLETSRKTKRSPVDGVFK